MPKNPEKPATSKLQGILTPEATKGVLAFLQNPEVQAGIKQSMDDYNNHPERFKLVRSIGDLTSGK